jgi:hypothetical protein
MHSNSLDGKKILDMPLSEFLSTINKNLPDELISKREKKKRERERVKMAKRHQKRVTYDLPPSLRLRLKQISSEHAVPESQIASLALARFIVDYEHGKIDLGLYKQPSSSPRYEWNLVLPQSLIPRPNLKK